MLFSLNHLIIVIIIICITCEIENTVFAFFCNVKKEELHHLCNILQKKPGRSYKIGLALSILPNAVQEIVLVFFFKGIFHSTTTTKNKLFFNFELLKCDLDDKIEAYHYVISIP